MFVTHLEIAPVYYKFIIGKQGQNKQRIEKETKTTVTILDKEQRLTITGPTANAVLNARTRIEIICETANHSLDYTHFLCLPLNYEEIMANVTKFQTEIIQQAAKNPIEGFDASIIHPPKQLHLTMLMLKLHTDSQIEKVKQILQQLQPQIYDVLDTRSLVVKLKGLEIMNDDPSQVDILYLQVLEEDGRLAKLTKFLVDKFKEQGLVSEEQDRNVKLHVTLFNTRYRKQELEGKREEKKGKERPKRETFNAHGIITKYGNMEFGTSRVAALHLSLRGAYDKNGFYQCIAKVDFP